MNPAHRLVGVLTILCLTTQVFAHPTTGPTSDLSEPAREMAEAGMKFLETLSPEQRQKAQLDFAGDERTNWHFVPKPRKGIAFGEMSLEQREAAIALLKSGLSQRGFEKTRAIMFEIEAILREIEGNWRDPGLYYVTLFGKPEPTGTWGWRVEGHHVSLNFTIVEGKAIAGAPSFLGSNPATVHDGPRKGLRVLAEEEDLGRKLINSLPPEQQKRAIIAERAPFDITTGNKRKITPGEPAGIAAGDLTPEHRQILMQLVQEYAHRLRSELAEQDLHKIEHAGADKIHFAWAGGLKPGQGHYYRIQGPTFLIEYDNTQNNANHIHCVWRDPANDFGEDILKTHYNEQSHD